MQADTNSGLGFFIPHDIVLILWTTEKYYAIFHLFYCFAWLAASLYYKIKYYPETPPKSCLLLFTWWVGVMASLGLVGIGTVVKCYCAFNPPGPCEVLVSTSGWDAWYLQVQTSF